MKKLDKIKNANAITLISLIVTIIVLLILAGVSISALTGKNSIIGNANEASFKTTMSQIAEEFDLYKMSEITGAMIDGTTVKPINAGALLKTMIEEDKASEEDDEESELSKIDIDTVVELDDILSSVKKEHDGYVIIVDSTLYYVCKTTLERDEKAQWCVDIGIPIWYYNPQTGEEPGINNTKGDYKFVNGIYVCTPILSDSAFSKYNTRYVYADENDNLVPGTWINKRPSEDWYDYANKKWANLYIENDGIDSYWVWIPRYVYKEASGERIDAKFVDINNNYTDAEGNVTKWSTLQSQGYLLPEAFKFADTELPGYWISKYQLSEHTDNDEYPVYFETVSTISTIKIQNVKTTSSEVAKYQYSINGEVMYECTDGGDYTFTGLAKGNKTINVTALNSDGEIIGSFTYYFEVADVNEPDTSGFDPDTTFYVCYDEDGTEHNETPISQAAPTNWYDYTTSNWANVVTRNNGVETYWVWIPRYQFQVNTTTQRVLVRFIKGTGTETESGYAIPEAFTFGGKELTGYWIAKYQLSTETSEPPVTAEMSAGSNLIRILDITGTDIAEGQIYEYYLNGVKKHEGTSSTEHYVFTGLEANTTYTVNIIVRDSATNAYVGAVTRKVITTAPNEPDISGFDKATTYYVTYDNGTEKRTPITEKAPSDWYDYSNQEWANIVTTANGTTSYWVWIPRYEIRILDNRDVLSKTNRRVEVNFLENTSTETTAGYEIPEAFTFGGQELTGYWVAKYQLSG